MKKLLFLLILVILVVTAGTALGAPLSQAMAREYIVQADDWLSKIADKEYADPLAYPAIVAATNAKVAEDDTFTVITNPNMIEVGQKLWIPASKFEGNYEANLPAASSPGRNMILKLMPDNTVELSTDYLNGEVPLVETGTWQDNGNGSATVALTGQANGLVYEQPEEITFQFLEKQLVATGYNQNTYGAAGLTFERQELGGIQPLDIVGIYKTMLPAASSPGIDSTLYLNTDNTVRLVDDYLNGEAPVEEVGTWAIAGNKVAVTITGQVGHTYGTPQIITFTLAGNVLATTPEVEIYGTAGRQYLSFDALATGDMPVPYNSTEAAQLMADNGLPGLYKGFSPAATCCGLDWTLTLNTDNSASLKSDYLNGEAPILENGVWSATENSLTVTLDGSDNPLSFTVAEGILVSNDYTIFGEAPLQLYRFEVIARH